jgi:hypothetical protein
MHAVTTSRVGEQLDVFLVCCNHRALETEEDFIGKEFQLKKYGNEVYYAASS